MILAIYIFLFVLMLFALYRAGKSFVESDGKITPIVIWAILIYTLNEGLRFGRGIDYNLYGMSYETLEATGDYDWDLSFLLIAKILIALDVPWQGYVLLMSFTFIVVTIKLLSVYKEVLPYALPFFVLFSIFETENMVRWYMGFSFIMIGIAHLLKHDRLIDSSDTAEQTEITNDEDTDDVEHTTNKHPHLIKYWLYCAFACTFHLALAPLPIAIFLIYRYKKVLISPIWTLVCYFAIAFIFKADFMLQFVALANMLSMTMSGVSERMGSYGDRAEYWLTGGYAGTEVHSPFPDMQELIFLCFLVWLGYKVIKNAERCYIFAYNMFLVGFLANPVARQIELIQRFDQPFLFFRAIVLACIVEYVFVRRQIVIHQTAWIVSVLICLNVGRRVLMTPINGNPEHYLYVWDIGNRTYDSMYETWIDDMESSDIQKKKESKE